MKAIGNFYSIWDDGFEIETFASFDKRTGEIETDSVDIDDFDLDILIDEYLIDDNGTRHEVCQECHSHIVIDGLCNQCGEL